MLKHYSGRVRLVIKFAPYPYRDNAKLAARAALAAQAQGKYWELHDKMLENYRRLNPEVFIELAREAGLNVEKFKVDLQAEWTKLRMEEDVTLTRSLDIWQTPTYLINGRTLVGERPFEHFQRIIDQELAAGEDQ